jgi:hypothetical protein
MQHTLWGYRWVDLLVACHCEVLYDANNNIIWSEHSFSQWFSYLIDGYAKETKTINVKDVALFEG